MFYCYSASFFNESPIADGFASGIRGRIPYVRSPLEAVMVEYPLGGTFTYLLMVHHEKVSYRHKGPKQRSHLKPWRVIVPFANNYFNSIQCIITLTLSASKAILRFLQTMQIQVSQLVTSCLTWNQHCLPFSYQNRPKL